MTDQQPETEERVFLEDIPLVLDTTYYPDGTDERDEFNLVAGEQPFVLLQMKQGEGCVVVEIAASWIESDAELAETLMVFADTLLAAAEARQEPTEEEEASDG